MAVAETKDVQALRSRPLGDRALRAAGWLLAALVIVTTTIADDSAIERDAAGILRASREALLATPSVSYGFVYGDRDEPTGWVSGRTRMRRVTRVADSWIQVEGTFHAQPHLGASEVRFAYASDGDQAVAIDHAARTYQRARLTDGANALAWRAVYGYFPEFVEPAPFWKELDHAARLSVTGTETVDDELCDVVRALFETDGAVYLDLRWSIARSDRLPRHGRWITPGGRADGLVMEVQDLRTGASPERSTFALAAPDGYERVETARIASVGNRVPDLSLARSDGGTVRLADLRGRIVVLDFWNTWCPMCRTVTPRTQALAAAFAGQPVAFFGVNLFETGDPVAYWRAGGFPYPLLLAGEQLAAALDIPWQPGVAVIGADGRVLHAQLGASHDRAERVRDAIRRGLAERFSAAADNP